MAKKESISSISSEVGGYIRQRKTKKGISYQVCLYLGKDYLGKNQYKYYTAKTKEEAQELLLKKQAEAILNGKDFSTRNSSMTVSQFLNLYFSEYVYDVLKPSTQRSYTYLAQYVEKLLGDRRLNELKSIDLQNFYRRILKCSPFSKDKKGLSLRTVSDVKRFVTVFLNAAVANELIEKNPNIGIKLPRNIKVDEPPKKEIYTMEEVSILLQNAKGSDLEMPLTILLDSGCRRGELLALTYDDIDWENNQIFITKNLTEGLNNTTHLVTPKTKAGYRKVTLTEHTMKLLKKSYTNYKREKMLNRDFIDTRLVIHKSNGEGIKPHSFYNKFCRFTKRIGLPHIRLHGLRSTSITLSIQNGCPIKAVSEKVGHSSVTITNNVYLKNTDKMREETTAIMENILQQAVNG